VCLLYPKYKEGRLNVLNFVKQQVKYKINVLFFLLLIRSSFHSLVFSP